MPVPPALRVAHVHRQCRLHPNHQLRITVHVPRCRSQCPVELDLHQCLRDHGGCLEHSLSLSRINIPRERLVDPPPCCFGPAAVFSCDASAMEAATEVAHRQRMQKIKYVFVRPCHANFKVSVCGTGTSDGDCIACLIVVRQVNWHSKIERDIGAQRHSQVHTISEAAVAQRTEPVHFGRLHHTG